MPMVGEHPSYQLRVQEHSSYQLRVQEHPSYQLHVQEHPSYQLRVQEHPSYQLCVQEHPCSSTVRLRSILLQICVVLEHAFNITLRLWGTLQPVLCGLSTFYQCSETTLATGPLPCASLYTSQSGESAHFAKWQR
jgi:hypothetical protein